MGRLEQVRLYGVPRPTKRRHSSSVRFRHTFSQTLSARVSVVAQIRKLLSSLPEARRLPSGLNATDQTPRAWPRRTVGSASGVPSSHSRMVVSPLPEARHLPSGLNATDEIPPAWPRRTGLK